MIYKGSLAPELLESEGKKLAVQAIRSFNPKAGASLKAHIVNHLQRLHRITQTRARAFRMPEELQQQVRNYQDVYTDLAEDLGHEPTVLQISEKMKWPVAKVQRLRKQFVSELPEGAQAYEAGVAANAPMDDRLLHTYYDLVPRDQLIFEHLTGFGGKPMKKKSEIAKILGVSPAVITQRSTHIYKRIKDAYGIGEHADE
jgi:DNA-directed RNA polymerase specialized sigma subunit